VFGGYLLASLYRHLVTILQDRSSKEKISAYPASLMILLVAGNIGGNGDDREDKPNRNYRKQHLFIEVMPLNVQAHTHT